MATEFGLFFSMFSNLLKNAVEASPPGGDIRISLKEAADCRIEIRNQGEIPVEIRPRFFTKYATHGKKAGTGLGAYSAKLMARTLGGELSFTSSPEDGTSLLFSLPASARVMEE